MCSKNQTGTRPRGAVLTLHFVSDVETRPGVRERGNRAEVSFRGARCYVSAGS